MIPSLYGDENIDVRYEVVRRKATIGLSGDALRQDRECPACIDKFPEEKGNLLHINAFPRICVEIFCAYYIYANCYLLINEVCRLYTQEFNYFSTHDRPVTSNRRCPAETHGHTALRPSRPARSFLTKFPPEAH